MLIEFLVEELSMEAALINLLPLALGQSDHYQIRVFQGKQDLLKKLRSRLQAYHAWLPEDGRVVILVDRDDEDCCKLKEQLEIAAATEGLATRSSAGEGSYRVLNRIVIEELEAWFFGDPAALRAAYPRVPASIGSRRTYRDPDCVPGGTAEALRRVLRQANYYTSGLPKIEVARRISRHMDPSRNRSHSFQVFWAALEELIASGS